MRKSNLENFLFGAASIMDLSPYLSENPFSKNNDAENLAKDWKNVGNDMSSAIAKHDDQKR